MSLDDRFWGKVEISDVCWEWRAYRNEKGYGQFRHHGRARYAHRLAFIDRNGEIPEGMQLDHLCRNPSCVRPDHLELVTPGVNTLRGEPAQRTHCPHGHAYMPENTYYHGNRRYCRTCHRAHEKTRRDQRRAA